MEERNRQRHNLPTQADRRWFRETSAGKATSLAKWDSRAAKNESYNPEICLPPKARGGRPKGATWVAYGGAERGWLNTIRGETVTPDDSRNRGRAEQSWTC